MLTKEQEELFNKVVAIKKEADLHTWTGLLATLVTDSMLELCVNKEDFLKVMEETFDTRLKKVREGS
jgi:hypothetical protein